MRHESGTLMPVCVLSDCHRSAAEWTSLKSHSHVINSNDRVALQDQQLHDYFLVSTLIFKLKQIEKIRANTRPLWRGPLHDGLVLRKYSKI